MHPRTSATLSVEQLEDRLVLSPPGFVQGLYNNLLNRSGNSTEINFWVNKINMGESNQAVATEFWRSAEHRGIEVDSYYQTFLHRASDPGGRAHWVSVLINPPTLPRGVAPEILVEASFMTSTEFLNAQNTPGTFISSVYLDVLFRAPNNNEVAFWQNVLAATNFATVTTLILTSFEAYTDVINLTGFGYYEKFLNRAADPAGLASWLSLLNTGQGTIETVAEGILGSQEYANLHP